LKAGSIAARNATSAADARARARSRAQAFGGNPRDLPCTAALGFLRRTIRTVRLAATDKRIPRPLRALATLGLMPIPGPFDEAVPVIVAVATLPVLQAAARRRLEKCRFHALRAPEPCRRGG
jgi:hypothetical protein